jgi:hypothetical protein
MRLPAAPNRVDLLHSSLKRLEGDLAQQFARAEPFRHIVVDDFLQPEFCKNLIAEFPPFDERAALNEMGKPGKKAVVPEIAKIGPAFRKFDSLMREQAFLKFVGQITGIDSLLYDPQYVGGGTHENLAGQDLDLHVDFNFHPQTLLHRRLNLIVFLNPEWREEWGGNLELCSNPWHPEQACRKTIVPVANRAVLFETTENSWHGFTQIQLPPDRGDLARRSIAVYFYTRERPAQETAAPHGTVYIPRPLPPHLRAGYTLEPSDEETLHAAIERRNTQIRFLYGREHEYTTALVGITNSLSFRVGRFLTWPVRKLFGR